MQRLMRPAATRLRDGAASPALARSVAGIPAAAIFLSTPAPSATLSPMPITTIGGSRGFGAQVDQHPAELAPADEEIVRPLQCRPADTDVVQRPQRAHADDETQCAQVRRYRGERPAQRQADRTSREARARRVRAGRGRRSGTPRAAPRSPRSGGRAARSAVLVEAIDQSGLEFSRPGFGPRARAASGSSPPPAARTRRRAGSRDSSRR